ncbi:toprim domain-containing protein [Mucilaginibacter agri]|uniref:Zinc finger CHC2-type domain-containing protein n=1 Tax=Mucilaginibacter agri TaxID=2695265 RepID=A0A965ZDJ3_9SPHI|nr:toprim domain-containing protein [Mucilaginibacter agri]NCD68278.1 hypothetical protein [Mucilaginibacter agri]
MPELLNAKELKERASIVSLLKHLGYEPVRKSGKELMYHSMLRDGDRTPSLSVNDHIGAWYDHGSGKGGNIIDFGLAYWPALTFSEVVDKLQQLSSESVQGPRSFRPRLPVKNRNYVIDRVCPLGGNPAISNYLLNRGIFEAARGHLSEVYYFLEINGARKAFFAAGWQNEAGGWEVRNKYFKGCIGSKGITVVPGDPRHVVLFEGYLNYLSWLSEYQDTSRSIIVLNTLSLLTAGIEKAKQFSVVDVYFDRDPAGFQAFKALHAALPYATDRSAAFEGFNDYNDKLLASFKTANKLGNGPEFQKGFSI